MIEQHCAPDQPVMALDITNEICPMTFVRTRLALDRLASGALLLVRLKGEEPRRNVPLTAIQQGHTVVDVTEEPGGTVRVLIRRR